MSKILAFSGSSSAKSINQRLVTHIAGGLQGAEVTLIDIREYPLPVYSIDIEQNEGIPENAQKLRALFDTHDGFLIACPEHNGLPPVIFKNLVDWLSRMDGKVFQQKPVLALATSPGPRGGQTVLGILTQLLPRWGAEVVGTVSVGKFAEAFDGENNQLTDPALQQEVDDQLATLVAATKEPANV